MMPPPAPPMPAQLVARYPAKCPACAHTFEIGPSLAMGGGINSGHATCSKCKTFCHVVLVDAGDDCRAAVRSWRAELEPWDDYLKRWTEEAPEAPVEGG